MTRYKCLYTNPPISLSLPLSLSVQPFVAEDHFIHDYFLPRWYAIVIPVVAGLMLLVIIGLFVGVVLMKESARKKAKQKQT